ncbi:NAD(P)H-dependent oxidoreductase [Leucobacter weissii]|uniref:NAD(P)H-dependent oxidoreductase n=1 Tax=Leucobacter weissii TaxID=1983706 RepID=A0A939S963_9MICO|nr:CE1759 family FMN reductase [Leucobacter weissii]MBO1902816.1 NAD(P)H-dependent oxidoreductase [Leucobacter weissii]
MSTRARTIVIVHAGTSSPSSTKLLADRIASRAAELGDGHGLETEIRTIDLGALSADVSNALVSRFVSPALRSAFDLLRDADGIVASTPVYQAVPSGLFISFFQALDTDLLIGMPVVLAATGGSARHSLVTDEQMRGLFAYLRTMTAPTSVFAAPEDWSEGSLSRRIDRAATELLLLMQSDFATRLRTESWGAYQHRLGSAGGAETAIDLDTGLMRLATGG